MAKTKTNETNVRLQDFIESYVESDQKVPDSYRLIAGILLRERISGHTERHF
jgi:hypothetical protein